MTAKARVAKTYMYCEISRRSGEGAAWKEYKAGPFYDRESFLKRMETVKSIRKVNGRKYCMTFSFLLHEYYGAASNPRPFLWGRNDFTTRALITGIPGINSRCYYLRVPCTSLVALFILLFLQRVRATTLTLSGSISAACDSRVSHTVRIISKYTRNFTAPLISF